MSEIRVNKLVNEAGTGAIELTEGGTIPSGKTISGSGTIAVNSSGTAAGLSGTPDITVGTVNGSTATFSGSVSIGGTLTYQDVTNIDSVGVITARAGADLNGYKVEGGNLDSSTGLTGEFDFLLENGHIQSYSSATAGNYQPDFKVSATKSLNSIMDVGDIITCTLMVASSSHYLTSASIKIDDSSSNLDIDNVGGSPPSAANGSGYDIYSFTIQKTAATPAYHIIVNTLGAA
tara:strand:+ start:560 stop:1258 length:699 start_codon:yes stop_codon:yes gene_type:complete